MDKDIGGYYQKDFEVERRGFVLELPKQDRSAQCGASLHQWGLCSRLGDVRVIDR